MKSENTAITTENSKQERRKELIGVLESISAAAKRISALLVLADLRSTDGAERRCGHEK